MSGFGRGSRHSEASKAKIRDALRGRVNGPHSLRTRKLISKAKQGIPLPKLQGRTLSAETRAKLSAAMTGRQMSEATKRKIARTMRGNRLFAGHHHSAASRERIGKGVRAAVARRREQLKRRGSST